MTDTLSKVPSNSQASLTAVLKGLFALLAVAAIVVGAIALLGGLLGPGIANFLSTLSTLDSAIVVAFISGTISILIFAVKSIVDGIMKKNEYLRMHRERPYLQLISMFYDLSAQTKAGKEFTTEELIERFNQFTKELVLWGSAKAIQEWGNWRVATSNGKPDPNVLLFGMEKVLNQLRKDMGLKRGIKQGDLLRLTVNDIDQYLPQMNG